MSKESHYRKLVLIGDKDEIINVLKKLKNWKLNEESNGVNLVKVLISQDDKNNKIWFKNIKEMDVSNTILLETINVVLQDSLNEKDQPKTVYEDLLFELYKDIHVSKSAGSEISISIALSDYELIMDK